MNQSTILEEKTKSGNLQIILSKSYTLFFFAFVIGLVIDILLKLKFNIQNIEFVGIIVLMLASILVYWAQSVNKTPKYLKSGERNFSYGPYAYSRHPTYFGIFLAMLGAGLTMNSISISIVSLVSLIISAYTFMEKEEQRHIKKYGQLYLDYMKKVRKII